MRYREMGRCNQAEAQWRPPFEIFEMVEGTSWLKYHVSL